MNTNKTETEKINEKFRLQNERYEKQIERAGRRYMAIWVLADILEKKWKKGTLESADVPLPRCMTFQ